MKSKAFVPGHVTGFFNIEDHEISLKSGSCGAGFLVEKGVETIISPADELIIDINQGSDIIVNEVLNIMDIDETFKITQNIQLPIGAGFGTSAASAFSLALAINKFLDLNYSVDICGQIAHKAEINLGGGLGDVIAQTGKGIVLRTQPGAPGIGEIESFISDVYIGCKSFGVIDTSSVIKNPKQKDIISACGLKYLDLFKKESDISSFLDFSYNFSKKTDLLTRDVENLINNFKNSNDILGSSMAMLGNTVFVFAYDKSTLKNLNIEGLDICKLNNVGIVYD